MLSTIHTIAINGLDASRVLIEINVTPFSQPRDALYVMAERTRVLLSFTALSGSPTMT